MMDKEYLKIVGELLKFLKRVEEKEAKEENKNDDK